MDFVQFALFHGVHERKDPESQSFSLSIKIDEVKIPEGFTMAVTGEDNEQIFSLAFAWLKEPIFKW